MPHTAAELTIKCCLLSCVFLFFFGGVHSSAQDLPARQTEADSLQGNDEIEGFYHIVEYHPDVDSLRREHAKLSHYVGHPDLEKGVVLNSLELERERGGKDTVYIDAMRKLESGYRVKTYDVGGDCTIIETRGKISFTHETIGRVLYCEDEVALLAGFAGRQDRLNVITRKMRRIGLDVMTNAIGNFQSLEDYTVECDETEEDAVTCDIIDHPCASVTRPYGAHWIMEFRCDFKW